VTANQAVRSEWLVFDQHTGVEKVWIIWSSNPLPDLDSIFARAAQAEYLGEITGAEEIAKIQDYLRLYDAAKLEVVSDKSTRMTSLKGHGEIIVGLLTLSHESY
jgi:hypothetical protein